MEKAIIMELIKYTTEWARGDALQGKIMLTVGILLIASCIFILKNDNSILKGSLIPLCLVVVICAGYGGFLTFSRPGHIVKTEKNYLRDPKMAVETELAKAVKDNNTYSLLKKIWPILIMVTAGLYYVMPSDYLKGLMIGMMTLFIAGLIIDSLLQDRLHPYLMVLKELSY